ncbi:MAG: Stp1/IreP family PP2C-type Ser/Thr phosphatase [Clostridia bacterium]|nr:Stp1/IreP family PP2C-type Ser/Thr phosphatase [Clostridia bacterium]
MRYSMKTDKGIVRESNQDNCYVTLFDDNSCFGVVCDGMGGPNAGDIASGIAVKEITDRFVEGFNADTSMQDASVLLSKAIKKANLKILGLATATPEYEGMGTTVVAFVCRGNELLIANVGDSRAYFVGEGLKQLTKDHSLVQEMIDKGELKAEDAAAYPYKNIITRALGVDNHVDIDFYSYSFDGNCLLLCSDGLYNFVNAEKITGLVNDTDIDFEDIAAELITAANNNGGGDNITAVLVKR